MSLKSRLFFHPIEPMIFSVNSDEIPGEAPFFHGKLPISMTSPMTSECCDGVSRLHRHLHRRPSSRGGELGIAVAGVAEPKTSAPGGFPQFFRWWMVFLPGKYGALRENLQENLDVFTINFTHWIGFHGKILTGNHGFCH